MNQNYYPTNPNLFVPQRLIADKFPKVQTLNSKVKPRQSEPPANLNDKKIYQPSKFAKDKEVNISNPYIPSSTINTASYRPGEPTDVKISNPTMKNYVNPYSQYPQCSVQPRLSKTIPYEEEFNKKGQLQNPQQNYNQYRDISKPELQTKRSLTRYENIPSVGTPTQGEENMKRVPRFSEPAMFNPSAEDNKFSFMPPSPCKTSSNSSYAHFSSPMESPSNLTPFSKISSFDPNNNKYSSSKNTSNSYSLTTASSTSSTLSNIHSAKTPKKQSQLRIGDFARGAELGSGKFGQVFLARHKETGFICAIKEISKKIIVEENILNQFIRELKIQSCLDHPNIIRLYGFFHDKNNIYLILELGSQGQLYKIIKEKKKLSEATVSFVIRQLCEAVKYLHSLSIIHRDIKPQNIVIQQGTVKICDFGWSVCRSGELRSTFCGTPLYVSPQILKGELYDEKIDIWALGILTYELLIGDTPFEIFSEEELVKIIKEDITFPPNINVSGDAKDFILRILKKNPDERMKVAKLIEHPFLNKTVEIFELDI